jgi:hemerythrin superfamily protein
LNTSLQSLLHKASPTITNMIRADHTHVLATFHQYEADTSPGTKQALANTIMLALEVHAQLEEEIFYPAMRGLNAEGQTVAKSFPEHDEMKRLIAVLRTMEPTDAAYDDTVMELMRDVIHHVADEETILLPAAEKLLGDRLEELGVQMTKRRIELVKPRAMEIAWNTARALPASTMLMGVGAVLVGALLLRGLGSGRHHGNGRHHAEHDGRHGRHGRHHDGHHDGRGGWLSALHESKDDLKKAARSAAREAGKQSDRLLASSGRAARKAAARADA